MNIKSETAHQMARTVARRTGTTVTAAVETALKEKIERLDHAGDVEAKYQRIKKLVESLPPAPPGLTSDHSDLYGDDGLPI